MLNYLGICIVIVVTGLVISLTAGVGTRCVLREIEEYKRRAAERQAKALKESSSAITEICTKAIEGICSMVKDKMTTKTVDYTKVYQQKKEDNEDKWTETMPPIKE